VFTGVAPRSSNSLEVDDVIALSKQAALPEQAIIYEVGSGSGSLVIEIARSFPKAQVGHLYSFSGPDLDESSNR
jgi:methylase of polypeptide subunit release factors